MTTITKRGARDRILDAAGSLFYEHGYRAVGIDTIIAEAGVAKMSLYAHFASKDDLIVAYLERAKAEGREWLDQALSSADTPKGKLIAVFKALAQKADSPECRGCPVQLTAAEFPDPDYPGHKVALDGKMEVRSRLLALAVEAGLREPEALADQLMLLMDGAYASARMYGSGNPARQAGEAARALIEAHSA